MNLQTMRMVQVTRNGHTFRIVYDNDDQAMLQVYRWFLDQEHGLEPADRAFLIFKILRGGM